MHVQHAFETYLQHATTMQLATVHAGQPWVCSVWFVAVEGKLYWLSFPSRRHSQELIADSTVAVAVAVKTDQPVVGLQAAGTAQVVADAQTVALVMERYVAKHGTGTEFLANFVAQTNKHHMYCFTPSTVVLFDEQRFPEHPQQQIEIR
jgi:uncharacterized protein YhbP (UPF0306 family)